MKLNAVSREVRDVLSGELLGWLVKEDFPFTGTCFSWAVKDERYPKAIKHCVFAWMPIQNGSEIYIAIGVGQDEEQRAILAVCPEFIPFVGLREEMRGKTLQDAKESHASLSTPPLQTIPT